jgi:mRNA interferase MazF
MISNELRHAEPGFDGVIRKTDTDFRATNLKAESLIRLSRLAVVDEQIFVGAIGKISSARLSDLKRSLAKRIEKS